MKDQRLVKMMMLGMVCGDSLLEDWQEDGPVTSETGSASHCRGFPSGDQQK